LGGNGVIPNAVKIAGLEYNVTDVDGLAEHHGLCGQVLYERCLIKLDSSLPADKKEQVFVHELVHGIFEQSGYDEQNEEMVNRLGIVLYQVLKDNKLYFGKEGVE
jgi:hypothetical protein